jgi:2,4-dienoyl-CoA reductase (NADPH2)
MKAEVAVVATGATIDVSALPGPNADRAVSAQIVLDGAVEAGQRVVVLSGGRAGLVTAEYLANRGKQVTVVEPDKRIANDVISTFKWRHYAWVKEFGIETLTGATVKAITAGEVVVVDGKGQARTIPADTVIFAGPRRSVQDLIDGLEFYCDELYVVGDAVKPRAIANAIHEGYKVGVRI